MTPIEIFQTYWPTQGYAGVKPHLPDWSSKKASGFAFRHGIKMEPAAKAALLENQMKRVHTHKKDHNPNSPRRLCACCEEQRPICEFANSKTDTCRRCASWKNVENTTARKALAMRW